MHDDRQLFPARVPVEDFQKLQPVQLNSYVQETSADTTTMARATSRTVDSSPEIAAWATHDDNNRSTRHQTRGEMS